MELPSLARPAAAGLQAADSRETYDTKTCAASGLAVQSQLVVMPVCQSSLFVLHAMDGRVSETLQASNN